MPILPIQTLLSLMRRIIPTDTKRYVLLEYLLEKNISKINRVTITLLETGAGSRLIIQKWISGVKCVITKHTLKVIPSRAVLFGDKMQQGDPPLRKNGKALLFG